MIRRSHLRRNMGRRVSEQRKLTLAKKKCSSSSSSPSSFDKELIGHWSRHDLVEHKVSDIFSRISGRRLGGQLLGCGGASHLTCPDP